MAVEKFLSENLSSYGQSCYSFHLRRSRLACLPQIVSRLLRDPSVCPPTALHAPPASQPQGHSRRNCSTAIQHPRQRSASHTKLPGSVGHGHTQGRQHVLTQGFAWVGGCEFASCSLLLVIVLKKLLHFSRAAPARRFRRRIPRRNVDAYSAPVPAFRGAHRRCRCR
jgi:hypothetical protein